jgi:Na+/melibiose symporter-like transporter
VICTGASFAVALVFWLVTTFTGDYPHVARWGGAAWIFLLVMIVLMPVVIPRMKRRRRTEQETSCSLPAADQQS